MENVRIYLSEAATYFSGGVNEYKLDEGDLVAVTHPTVAFITVVATHVTKVGRFRIGYLYEDRDPSTLSENEKTSTVVVKPIRDAVVEKEVHYTQTNEFFLLILASSVFASLLVILCVLCCVFKH